VQKKKDINTSKIILHHLSSTFNSAQLETVVKDYYIHIYHDSIKISEPTFSIALLHGCVHLNWDQIQFVWLLCKRG